MPVVKMPDGTDVSFPDDMPPDQIRGMIATKFPKEAAGVNAPGASGLAKALDRGVGDLVSGTLGLPRTLTDLGAMGIDAASNKINDYFGTPRAADDTGQLKQTLKNLAPSKETLDKFLPTADKFQEEIQNRYYGGEKPYEPQNTGEEYMRTFGSFAGGAGGPGGLIRRGAQWLIPALASETAGQATKDAKVAGYSIEPVARFLGALTGMGVQSFLRPGTSRELLERQLPRGVTMQHVDDADALMHDAATHGIQISWPEALSQVAGQKVFSDLMRHLEAAPQTASRMDDFFAARPRQIEAAAARGGEAISPGAPTPPSSVGPALQREATGAADAERQAINARSDAQYYAASHQSASPQEMAYLRSLPGWDEAATAIRNARTNPQLERYVRGLPDDSLGFVNEVKKYMGQARDNATSGVATQGRNMQTAAGWGADEEAVRNTAVRASQRQTATGVTPPYEEALRVQSEGRERLQTLLDGPLGKLAENHAGTKSALEILFPKDPLAHSQGEISDAVTRIANRSPKLAEDAVRAHIDTAFDKFARDLQTGPNQASGAKFRAGIAGSGQQRANLQAAVEALPDGAERWRGFNRLLDIMEATGTRLNKGSLTAYNTEALKEIGGATGSMADAGVRAAANPMRALQPIVDKYDQFKFGRNLNDLAAMMTDRRSVGMLRDLVGSARGSFREANIARALILANTTPRQDAAK